jgi:hypothetical protein
MCCCLSVTFHSLTVPSVKLFFLLKAHTVDELRSPPSRPYPLDEKEYFLIPEGYLVNRRPKREPQRKQVSINFYLSVVHANTFITTGSSHK